MSGGSPALLPSTELAQDSRLYSSSSLETVERSSAVSLCCIISTLTASEFFSNSLSLFFINRRTGMWIILLSYPLITAAGWHYAIFVLPPYALTWSLKWFLLHWLNFCFRYSSPSMLQKSEHCATVGFVASRAVRDHDVASYLNETSEFPKNFDLFDPPHNLPTSKMR